MRGVCDVGSFGIGTAPVKPGMARPLPDSGQAATNALPPVDANWGRYVTNGHRSVCARTVRARSAVATQADPGRLAALNAAARLLVGRVAEAFARSAILPGWTADSLMLRRQAIRPVVGAEIGA